MSLHSRVDDIPIVMTLLLSSAAARECFIKNFERFNSREVEESPADWTVSWSGRTAKLVDQQAIDASLPAVIVRLSQPREAFVLHFDQTPMRDRVSNPIIER